MKGTAWMTPRRIASRTYHLTALTTTTPATKTPTTGATRIMGRCATNSPRNGKATNRATRLPRRYRHLWGRSAGWDMAGLLLPAAAESLIKPDQRGQHIALGLGQFLLGGQ